MSSQRGNVKKRGPPKYRNKTAYKNNMHDDSAKTKMLNTLEISGCCARCMDIIKWKIKYKKYKPLSQPKKCTKCQQKAVKRAYYIVCQPCAEKLRVCAKCGEKKEIVLQPGLSPAEEAAQQSQYEEELKHLPERQRRTFLRLNASGKLRDAASDHKDVEDSASDEDISEDDQAEPTDDELEAFDKLNIHKTEPKVKSVHFNIETKQSKESETASDANKVGD